MKLSFNIRGNLKPYKVNTISIENFQETFVNTFQNNAKRKELHQYYQIYVEQLKRLVKEDFYQLIDGSFVSSKKNLKDIDIVTILNYQDYEENKVMLEEEYASFAGRKKYNIDGYILPNYPKEHKNYIFTKSDLIYWRNLFGTTKVNRVKKQYKNGIIQINFLKNG